MATEYRQIYPCTHNVEKYRRIFVQDKEYGIFCTACRKEYELNDMCGYIQKKDFLRSPKNQSHQVQNHRTEIDPNWFADILKPGDHVAWQRPYLIWHHAIVIEVNAVEKTINVISWDKIDGLSQIVETTVEVKQKLFSTIHRIEYSRDITEANPTELVLARARCRKGDRGYRLLNDNCESFSTYCKTGFSESNQKTWLGNRNVISYKSINVAAIKEFLKRGVQICAQTVTDDAISAAVKVIPAEAVEHVMKASDAVGMGLIFAFEGYCVTCDLHTFYKARKEGKLSFVGFVQSATQRVIEGICAATGASLASWGGGILGAFIGSYFGPPGIVVGGLIGSIVGGIVGALTGRAIGTAGGAYIGKLITKSMPSDRAVTCQSQLQPGDHIILSMWLLHPRCHAIFVNNEDENTILVIRNTHKDGVLAERIRYKDVSPIYRVEYSEDDCIPAEEVIKNAKERIGEKKYNLATYNCKTFARYCKTGSLKKK